MTELVPVANSELNAGALAEMAVASLPSPASRRVYKAHLARFILAGVPLTRTAIQAYMQRLRENGSIASANQALHSIKRLCREAWEHGMMSEHQLASILRIETVQRRGTRAGNWLELGGLKALLEAAASGDGDNENGTRNVAVVAVLAGCGLRREEVAGLRWSHLQQRSGRWCFVDVEGKGNKVRTVPVPDWAVKRLVQWKEQQEQETTK